MSKNCRFITKFCIFRQHSEFRIFLCETKLTKFLVFTSKYKKSENENNDIVTNQEKRLLDIETNGSSR